MEIRPLLGTDAPAIHRSLLGDPEVAAWFRSSGPLLGLVSIVAYARADNGALRGVMAALEMAYEKDFDFDGEPHVLYRKPLAPR